jgi:hypothetical protein
MHGPFLQALKGAGHQAPLSGKPAQQQRPAAAAADLEAGAAPGQDPAAAPSASPSNHRLMAWWQRQPMWLRKSVSAGTIGVLMTAQLLASVAATRLTQAYLVSG